MLSKRRRGQAKGIDGDDLVQTLDQAGEDGQGL